MRFLADPKENTALESLKWCRELALSTEEAVKRISGKGIEKPIEKRYSSIFEDAERIAQNSPIKMGGAGNLNLLYWLSTHQNAENIIETGVAYGWSSLALILSLQDRQTGKLVSIDMPYPKLDNEEHVGCVVPESMRSRWELIRLPDRQGLPKALSILGTIDLCHYDSDKTYIGRMWAYPRLWKALKKGGLLISDDIEDNIAFRDFSQELKLEPFVIKTGEKYVGILQKNN